MASQPAASILLDSFRPVNNAAIDRYAELFSEVPIEGQNFITSLSFCNSMTEACSEAKAKGLISSAIGTAYAVQEFSRFLALKIYLHDTMADKISPTPLMDAVVRFLSFLLPVF